MSRLQAELHRLYLPQAGGDAEHIGVTGPDGRTSAMVLELARPASWDALAPVWQGVQAELELPAPAIAVSGVDGYQLWFSLAEPVPAARAIAFLEALQARYLPQVAPDRIRTVPSGAAAAGAAGDAGFVGRMPPVQAAPGRWSAFVAADLAALFADEPWLDMTPNADAQAELLSRLRSIRPSDLERALQRLAPPETAGAEPAAAPGRRQDPAAFLLAVMNDPSVDLALRIEAAKALLPHAQGGRP